MDVAGVGTGEGVEDRVDLETVFSAYYDRIARAIAFVTGDRGQAEELAVEVFLRWSRQGSGGGANPEGWLYRTASNLAIDALRKRRRREKLDRFLHIFRHPLTPEEIHFTNQERERVRKVLSGLRSQQAQLLILRTHGLSYDELADALKLKPASVGTLLARAQRTFQKEYIAKYGPQ